MKYILSESFGDKDLGKTAVGKARADIEKIAHDCGYEVLNIPMIDPKYAYSHYTHLKVYNNLKHNFPKMGKGDVLLLQLPLRQHTLLLSRFLKKQKRAGVKIYALIHDLDSLRFSMNKETSYKERIRRKLEETGALALCDAIIAHNNKMKSALKTMGIEESKIIDLEIFDYLSELPIKDRALDKTVIIAGNLSEEKSKYIYKLPDNVSFNLYGIRYTGVQNDTISYKGSFSSEELAEKVEGCFGLVWDGDSLDTCSGHYGQYLKINNPHKTSFYLSCGLPVLIWKEAALADFVAENKCGILIESLNELKDILDKLTEDEYREIWENAVKVSEKLQKGYFFENALKKADSITGAAV